MFMMACIQFFSLSTWSLPLSLEPHPGSDGSWGVFIYSNISCPPPRIQGPCLVHARSPPPPLVGKLKGKRKKIVGQCPNRSPPSRAPNKCATDFLMWTFIRGGCNLGPRKFLVPQILAVICNTVPQPHPRPWLEPDLDDHYPRRNLEPLFNGDSSRLGFSGARWSRGLTH